MQDLEKKIGEIKRIKEFGEELGLYFGENFKRVDLSDTLFCFIWASYKDNLEPVFGYDELYECYDDDRESAEERARELKEIGYDVYLCDVSAQGPIETDGVSANDSESCPITKALLEEPPEEMASTVLHESFHFYIEARGLYLPLNLNEAIATYIGFKGAIEFYRDNPELLREAGKQMDDWMHFVEFVNMYYDLLTDCYEKGILSKEKILAGANRDAKELGIEDEVNNAFFLYAYTYTRNAGIVFETMEKQSIKKYLKNPREINSFLLEHTELDIVIEDF